MRFFKINLISADDHWILPMIEHSGPRSSTLANDRTLWPMIVLFRTWSSAFAHDRTLNDRPLWLMIKQNDHRSYALAHDRALWTMILYFELRSYTDDFGYQEIQLWNWNFALGKSQMTDLEVTDSVFDIYMYANRPSHSWNWHLKIFI